MSKLSPFKKLIVQPNPISIIIQIVIVYEREWNSKYKKSTIEYSFPV
jgi:hypothetical protein